jgi:hypothetical protein
MIHLNFKQILNLLSVYDLCKSYDVFVSGDQSISLYYNLKPFGYYLKGFHLKNKTKIMHLEFETDALHAGHDVTKHGDRAVPITKHHLMCLNSECC